MWTVCLNDENSGEEGLNREPRALCIKVVRSRGSGVIGMDISNVLKQVSNICRCISASNIKH